jgi:hypothetical protein
MENMLQRVIRVGMHSMLDGFLICNQVLIKEEDQLKTTFTIPLGNFKYLKMPFGILNFGSTFQRAMDFAFRDLDGNIIEI